MADWELGRPAVQAAAQGDPAVVLHGRLPVDELRRLMRDWRILIAIPATDPSSATLLDRVAVGVIPIVNDLVAYREWIDAKIGEVMSADPDESDFADAMVRATRRKVDPERIRDRVRAVAWEAQVDALRCACRTLVNAPR